MATLRGVIASLAFLALAGCGFQPLYGANSSAPAIDLARIRIGLIQEQPDPAGRNAQVARAAQELRNFLLERVTPRGNPLAPVYELTVTLQESKSSLAIRTDETATRANLNLIASYNLVRLDNGAVLLTSNARSNVSYNILRNGFATLTAENDARRRAAREVSDTISVQVANAVGAMREGAR
jgi:LPS-assembly lipoprotein